MGRDTAAQADSIDWFARHRYGLPQVRLAIGVTLSSNACSFINASPEDCSSWNAPGPIPSSRLAQGVPNAPATAVRAQGAAFHQYGEMLPSMRVEEPEAPSNLFEVISP